MLIFLKINSKIDNHEEEHMKLTVARTVAPQI